MLSTCGTRVRVRHVERLPRDEGCLLVVANHRSFLDAPLLLWGLHKPMQFVCHHYLAQVPVVNELVRQLGGFHMGPGGQGWSRLFAQAGRFMRTGRDVVIFPEGAELITRDSAPGQGGSFRRGFAHLAMRSGVEDLAIVPVSIVSHGEARGPLVPLWLLSLFDASEPMFRREGWHPYVLYERAEVVVGEPRRVSAGERARYRSGDAAQITAALAREMEQATRALTCESLRKPW
jgi:1-acyl-sn-glycerol-3-phosphate acyltransferase